MKKKMIQYEKMVTHDMIKITLSKCVCITIQKSKTATN